MTADAVAAAAGAASILASGLCCLRRGVWPPAAPCVSLWLGFWVPWAAIDLPLAPRFPSPVGRAFLWRFADHAALSEMTMAFASINASVLSCRYRFRRWFLRGFADHAALSELTMAFASINTSVRFCRRPGSVTIHHCSILGFPSLCLLPPLWRFSACQCCDLICRQICGAIAFLRRFADHTALLEVTMAFASVNTSV